MGPKRNRSVVERILIDLELEKQEIERFPCVVMKMIQVVIE
jgi:hypothetical protein